MTIEVHVVRVFIDADGAHGNPLGIVDAATVPDETARQVLAKELGFSATVFVDLPEPGGRAARAQIFTPAAELAFGGHPTVGLAWWLEQQGLPVDTLDVPAGQVSACNRHDATWVRADPDWASDFALYPMTSLDDVLAARPNDFTSGHHYIWAWEDELEGRIRSRMFAPGVGADEDEGTGAAAVRITAHLRRSLLITQGPGSQLRTTHDDHGWVEVGGLVRADRTRQV